MSDQPKLTWIDRPEGKQLATRVGHRYKVIRFLIEPRPQFALYPFRLKIADVEIHCESVEAAQDMAERIVDAVEK